ncbi:hypothetical protein L916_16864 [Phytophthora nicotianae]|uniref:Uncharacterized protein n=1 Tax=Phytophthora nicotianae TaxID=4792 RepID=W2I7L2_PHYNI|nr:hypothetical protein L916_16864 [Phytophthora nicotianae]
MARTFCASAVGSSSTRLVELTWNESKNTSTAAARNVCRLTRSRISTSRL